jgi:hypothetical protein
VFDWLKQLFSTRPEPEQEYVHRDAEAPPLIPAAPASASGPPPAVPVEKPVPEEPGRQP